MQVYQSERLNFRSLAIPDKVTPETLYKDLGKVKIVKDKSGYRFVTDRWSSDLATAKEKNGEKLLSLTSAPWSGGAELRVSNDKSRKLTMDDEQVKYEFDEIK